MGISVIEHPIPIVLKSILADKSTGELIFKASNTKKSLFFNKGELVFAKTNMIQERLGEILFKAGKIDKIQFWNIRKLIEGKKEKIGKILVSSDILSQKDIYDGIRMQISAIAVSTFSEDTGSWEFKEKPLNLPEDSIFKINLPKIIAAGLKRIKNFYFYKNQYFLKSPVFGKIDKFVTNSLSSEKIDFCNNLKKYPDMSNEKIKAKLNLGESEYWKNIVFFYLLGIVDFKEISEKKDISKNIDEVIKIYNKIHGKNLDYYEILGLNKDSSLEEIKESYFSYAKKFHPDRMVPAPDPEIKEKANFVFAEINRAFDILSNMKKKRDYDMKNIDSAETEGENNGKVQERGRSLYRKAKTLFAQKNFWEATALLEEAINLSPDKGQYFLLLGLCQMNLSNMKRAAEKNLIRASEIEPWNAEPFTALGLLFMNESMKNRAESFFRKALSLNPDNTVAKKRLNELVKGSSKKRSKSSIFKKKS
ncbi:MAG: DnaJ domain-containing protein [Acidobacteriota bacterium]